MLRRKKPSFIGGIFVLFVTAQVFVNACPIIKSIKVDPPVGCIYSTFVASVAQGQIEWNDYEYNKQYKWKVSDPVGKVVQETEWIDIKEGDGDSGGAVIPAYIIPDDDTIELTSGRYMVELSIRAEDSSGNRQSSRKSVEFLVIEVVEIKTKRKGAGEWDAGITSIAVGSVDSDIHKAEVTILIEPAEEGIPVPVRFEAGVDKPGRDAVLILNDTEIQAGNGNTTMVTTDSYGTLKGTLLSSDVLTSAKECKITACEKSKNVDFVWDNYAGDDFWQVDPDVLIEGQEYINKIIFRLDGTGLDNHDIVVFIEAVTYIDQNGNTVTELNTPQNPKDMSEYGLFPKQPTKTDNNGIATVKMNIKEVAGKDLESVLLVAYDYNATHTVGDLNAVPLGSMTWGIEPAAGNEPTDTPSDERKNKESKAKGKKGDRKGIVKKCDVIPVVPKKFKNSFSFAFRAFLDMKYGDARKNLLKIKVFNKKTGKEADADSEAGVLPKSGLTNGSPVIGKQMSAYATAHVYVLKEGSYELEIKYDGEIIGDEVGKRVPFSGVKGKMTFPENKAIKIQSDDYSLTLILPLAYENEKGKEVELKTSSTIVSIPKGSSVRFKKKVDETIDFGDFIKVTEVTEIKIKLDPEKEGSGNLQRSRTKGIYQLQQRQSSRKPDKNSTTGFTKWKQITVWPNGMLKDDITMVCPDLGIVTPKDEAEFVFDNKKPAKEKAGECMFSAEMKKLQGIPKKHQKLIIDRILWEIGNADNVAPEYDPKNRHAKSITITYPQMPNSYDGFGKKKISLALTGKEWKWYRRIKLKYHAVGTGHPNRAPIANVTAKQTAPNFWYYHLQVGAAVVPVNTPCNVMRNA